MLLFFLALGGGSEFRRWRGEGRGGGDKCSTISGGREWACFQRRGELDGLHAECGCEICGEYCTARRGSKLKLCATQTRKGELCGRREVKNVDGESLVRAKGLQQLCVEGGRLSGGRGRPAVAACGVRELYT